MLDDAQFLFTVTGSQHPFQSNHLASETTLIPFYRQLTGEWKAESAVVVPMSAGDESIGEIWLASMRPEHFDASDLQLAIIVAAELAGVIRQNHLLIQTDSNLRQRVDQLTVIGQVDREINAILELEPLLQTIYDEALRLSGADCGLVYYFAPNEDAELSAGYPPVISLVKGEVYQGNFSSIEKSVFENQLLMNIPNVNKIEEFIGHEGITSAIILPIVSQRKTLALVVLHSRFSDHFSDVVETLQVLMAHAAISLENALRYDMVGQRLTQVNEELEIKDKLIQVGQTLRPNRPLQEALNDICSTIQLATSFRSVSISIYDAATKLLRRVSQGGISNSTLDHFSERPQPWLLVQTLLLPEYKRGKAYRVSSDLLFEVVMGGPQSPFEVLPSPDPDSELADGKEFLLLPLYTADKTPLGLIAMGSPQNGLMPDLPTIKALDLFSIQVSMIIDSNRYITALASSLSDVEASYSRMLQSSTNSQQRISMMLHKEVEQVLINHHLIHELDRISLLPEIIELTNQQQDMGSLLHTVAEAVLLHFNFQIGLIGVRTRTQFSVLDMVGNLPSNMNPETWMGQHNPLRQALQDGQMRIVRDIQEDPDHFSASPMMKVLEAKSFIVLPFNIDPDRTAAILFAGDKPALSLIEEDKSILTQLMRQISGRLQNQQLLTETMKRLNEVNLLLDFTQNLNLLGSKNPSSKEPGRFDPVRILSFLLDSVTRVVQTAQAGWIGLWDDQERAIIPMTGMGFTDINSLLRIKFKDDQEFADNLLPIQVYHSGIALRVDEIRFAQNYRLPSDDLMLFRKATNQRLPESSMLIPFHQGETISGILVLDNYEIEAAFSDQDETMVLSLIHQGILALENARLFAEAEQRTEQLKGLNQVTSAISSSLNTSELIDLTLGQLRKMIPYNTATLWLRENQELVIAAVNGFADNQSRVGLKVFVEDSALFKEMLQTGDVISVPDIRLDNRFPSLLEPENMCWLGVPLKEKTQLLGMVALEKKEPGFYNIDQIQITKTFVSQVVAALENARLFEESENRAVELNLRTQRLSILNQLSSDLGALLDIDSILKSTSQQLLTALNMASVGAVIIEGNHYVLKADMPATPLVHLPLTLPAVPLFEKLKETQGVYVSNNLVVETELAPLLDSYFGLRGARAVLIVPLISAGQIYGWLLVQNNIPYRFNMQEIELARTIGNQVAMAVQKANLLEETRSLSAYLESRVVERTAELQKEHQYTEALLRITTELSSSLELEQVLTNTLAILNQSLGADQSLILLSDGTSRHYEAGVPLIDLQKAAEQPFAFQIDQSLINLFLRDQDILIKDFYTDDLFDIPDKQNIPFRSVISTPLRLTDQFIGTLLLMNRHTNVFNEDHARLIQAAARQISVAMNNAELYEISTDQSNRLIDMLRNEEIASSRSFSILEAVADGVLVTDSDNVITLFNNSAERILDVHSGKVVGKKLDQFFTLFGNVAQQWMQTIHRWSNDPHSFQSGDSYSEQLNLKNNRVVLVSLAPVIMGEVFLGTVSIFRDITHQVQVDRLKSEFVANVSHELRTPMTSIKGYVDILLMGAAGDITSQQAQFLQVVKSNTERLGVLVNDLLDVSRIEAGRAVLSFKALNLQEIINEVYKDIQSHIDELGKPMSILCEISSELPTVRGDRDRIHQVLGNLVMNAYNYTPENGKIKIQAKLENEMVQIDVIDNGIGITPKNQHRIFERFYRGEDPLVLATAGTGLGLAMSRILVEMHGGKIWFNSKGVPGEGSVFSFTLPIYKQEE